MGARADLDYQMRHTLLQLAVCSHARTGSYQPTGRSGATKSVDLSGGDTKSVDLSGGDTGASAFAQLYGPPFFDPRTGSLDGEAVELAWEIGVSTRFPRSDFERRRVLEAARAELKTIRGGGAHDRAMTRPAGETHEQLVARMLRETVGMRPEDVQTSRFRMAARSVRRLRIKDGRDPETGRLIDRQPKGSLARDARRVRLLDLVERRGYTLADAARVVGVSRATAERDLGRRAA